MQNRSTVTISNWEYNLFPLNTALRISIVTYFDIQLNVSMEKGIVLLADLRAAKRSFNNPVSIFK